jgi:alkylation response protein AidB-like acyl-CoA dehydrogenase
MTVYVAPTQETWFVLRHVVRINDLGHLPGYATLDEDSVKAILDGVGKFAANVLQPLNHVGDTEGCSRATDGTVSTPTGFKAAYDQWVEAGWPTLEASPEYGGMGLPKVLATAVAEYVLSANQSFETYTGLTAAAVSAIEAAASPELKATYLPRMVVGEWTGTMNLTEPHCGTDLGLLLTRAEPAGDGSYRITGNKIFITGGEQDLTENIVHLVLARLPDAPAGTKGISMFLVPKVLPSGEPNNLGCGAIEHKMGLRGSATCAMNYDGATGWLVGQEHKGLAAMFVMMNSARLGVGLQGVAQAEAAFQNGKAYAMERRQGRVGRQPMEAGQSADPIIAHPDVRRMLLEAKANIEGTRTLCLWASTLVDIGAQSADANAREEAEDLLALLTPVIKAFSSDKGFETTVNCQQMWGGHGYITENGMDQFVRDARLAMIYEGANGVQAMDLVGRKLFANDGRAFALLNGRITAKIADCASEPALADIATALSQAQSHLIEAARWMQTAAAERPEDMGAGATAFLHLTGTVVMGYMWLLMAEAAQQMPDQSEFGPEYLAAKIETARFYAQRMLPDAVSLAAKVAAGSQRWMAIPLDQI